VAVAVHEPGDHAAALGVDARVCRRRIRGVAHPADDAVFNDDGRVFAFGGQPAVRLVIGYQEADLVDQGACHARNFRPAAASSTHRATSLTVRPSATSLVASTSVRSIET